MSCRILTMRITNTWAVCAPHIRDAIFRPQELSVRWDTYQQSHTHPSTLFSPLAPFHESIPLMTETSNNTNQWTEKCGKPIPLAEITTECLKWTSLQACSKTAEGTKSRNISLALSIVFFLSDTVFHGIIPKELEAPDIIKLIVTTSPRLFE